MKLSKYMMAQIFVLLQSNSLIPATHGIDDFSVLEISKSDPIYKEDWIASIVVDAPVGEMSIIKIKLPLY